MLDVAELMRAEMATADPWRLTTNPFERRRYDIALDMISTHGRAFERGLEVGCAGGVFTEMLAARCSTLHVIDVMPEAIARAQQRLSHRANITWEVGSVADGFAPGRTFDLIVVMEVLCLLPDHDAVRRAVNRLAAALEPGGVLIFGSPVDETCKRWGLTSPGAETTVVEWERHLREVNRAACFGAYWGENSRIMAYTRDAQQALTGFSSRTPETYLAPTAAVPEIPAARALAIGDSGVDVVLGCGGSIAKRGAQNLPTRIAITGAAREDRGGDADAAWKAAARHLNCASPEFWNFPPAFAPHDNGLLARLKDALAGVDLVYAPAPSEQHPRQRRLAMAVMHALQDSPSTARIAFYEVSAPLRPNLLVDITDTADAKTAAAACFDSAFARQPADPQVFALNRYRACGLSGDIAAAEGYLVLSGDDLRTDPLKLHRPEHERHRADLATAGAELHNLKTRIMEIEREIAGVRKSSSWKLTSPLRWARRLMGP